MMMMNSKYTNSEDLRWFDFKMEIRKHTAWISMRPAEGEIQGLTCCTPICPGESTNAAAYRKHGERSTFCLLLKWMQTVECDILCISFVAAVQSQGSTFCYSRTYWLGDCCRGKGALVAAPLSGYNPIQAVRGQFVEKRRLPFWNVEL